MTIQTTAATIPRHECLEGKRETTAPLDLIGQKIWLPVETAKLSEENRVFLAQVEQHRISIGFRPWLIAAGVQVNQHFSVSHKCLLNEGPELHNTQTSNSAKKKLFQDKSKYGQKIYRLRLQSCQKKTGSFWHKLSNIAFPLDSVHDSLLLKSKSTNIFRCHKSAY